jgi:hypothetical protein
MPTVPSTRPRLTIQAIKKRPGRSPDAVLRHAATAPSRIRKPEIGRESERQDEAKERQTEKGIRRRLQGRTYLLRKTFFDPELARTGSLPGRRGLIEFPKDPIARLK